MDITRRPIFRRIMSPLAPAAIATLMLSFALSGPLYSAERFNLYGLEFPQPKSAPIISAEGRVITPPDFMVTEVEFELDKQGRVSGLIWNYPPADSQKFEPYRESLGQITFHPARYDGKNIAFTLSALLVVSNRTLGLPVRLILPVDTGGAVQHPDLLVESAQANGFHPMQLVSFPSYFYLKPPVIADTALLPHIAVLRIEIDESGSLQSREILYASRSDLAEMILIAANWAEYSAGDYLGQTIGGVGILVVQFFNEIKYPTPKWQSQTALKSGLDNLRISWYPENVDFIQLPLLRKTGAMGAALAYDRNSPKKALIQVDANGRVRVERTRGVNARADRKLLKERIEALRFYPGFRLYHSPDSGYLPETMFAFGAIDLAPLDSLTYDIQTDFSLRKFQFLQRAPAK